MKKIFSLLSFLAITLIGFSQDNDKKESLEIGAKMPFQKYELVNPDGGETATLLDLKKEAGTLVIFSCNTCPFVVAWEDRYNKIHEAALRNGVGMVLVNSNEAKRDGDDHPKRMIDHGKKMGYTMPYLIDNNHELADAFGAKSTPHVFLFDSDDNLVYKGAIDDNHKDKNAVTKRYLTDALNKLNTGEEINPNTTRALGCSIKRIKDHNHDHNHKH